MTLYRVAVEYSTELLVVAESPEHAKYLAQQNWRRYVSDYDAAIGQPVVQRADDPLPMDYEPGSAVIGATGSVEDWLAGRVT